MACDNCGKSGCGSTCERVVITKKGERGFSGPPGPQGVSGAVGATGATGPTGPAADADYTFYEANLTQTGVAAPVEQPNAENTIGTITPTYVTPGKYKLTSAALFTADKTRSYISASAEGSTVNTIMIQWVNTSEIWIHTYNITGAAYADTILNNTSVFIKVKN